MMHSDQVLMFLFTLCRLVLSLLNSARHIVGLSMAEGDDAVTMGRHQKLYGMSVVIEICLIDLGPYVISFSSVDLMSSFMSVSCPHKFDGLGWRSTCIFSIVPACLTVSSLRG